METIQDIQSTIIEEFAFFDDWTDKYEYIIELGKSLEGMDPQFKTQENIITGCQSQVWLHASLENGKVQLAAESDAIIVKGLIALLLRVYNNQKPEDIIKEEPKFIMEIGMQNHLSPTRSNGLLSMVKQIKFYAIAFSSK